MPHRLLAAAAAIAAVVVVNPAAAQTRAVTPRPVPSVQPIQNVPALHQPSNLELQMKIDELNASVEQMSERLNALSSQLVTLTKQEQDNSGNLDAKIYLTCRMLYLHSHGDTPENANIAKQECKAAGWQVGN